MVRAAGVNRVKGYRGDAGVGVWVVVFENAICRIADNTDTGAVMLQICKPLRSSIIVVGSEDYLPPWLIVAERQSQRRHGATLRVGDDRDVQQHVSAGKIYRIHAGTLIRLVRQKAAIEILPPCGG